MVWKINSGGDFSRHVQHITEKIFEALIAPGFESYRVSGAWHPACTGLSYFYVRVRGSYQLARKAIVQRAAALSPLTVHGRQFFDNRSQNRR